MIRSVDQYLIEVLLTLALVKGGYALASAIHFSGPIAMVVAGLRIGNPGRARAMWIAHETIWTRSGSYSTSCSTRYCLSSSV